MRFIAKATVPLRPVASVQATPPQCPLELKFVRFCLSQPWPPRPDPLHPASLLSAYRLKDVPELGYYSEDRPHPRGELWVKSADTVSGYFKDDAANAAGFDSDGYFCTGDIVEMDNVTNTIKIIDRRKHFFKLAQGEYVAPERLEKVFLLSPYVKMIYIYAESLESYVLAVVVPHQAMLETWANKHDVSFDSFENLCANPRAVAEVLKSLATLAADLNHQIQPFELPRGILLEPVPFSGEDGLLTATFKLKRLNLQHKYKGIMRNMYDEVNESLVRTRIRTLRALISKHVHLPPGEASSSSTTPPVSQDEMAGDAPLTDWGLDSLAAIRLSNVIKSEFGVEIAAENLASGKASFDSLAKLVSEKKSPVESQLGLSTSGLYKPQKKVDWVQESTLDDPILLRLKSLPRVDPYANNASPMNTIFLTGATGFFGIFLLRELLDTTQATVLCLVRAPKNSAATERLVKVAKRMWTDLVAEQIDDIFSKRVVAVCGDLSLPRFGATEADWNDLTTEVDCIIHNGCRVNTVFSYEAMAAENVGGTRTCLEVATTHKVKPIIYISTLSAIGPMMDADLEGREFVETHVDGKWLEMMGGYGSSKRVSELLLENARKAGLPTIIIRPGTIGPHSKTGACNLTDYHTKLFLGIEQIAAAPQSLQKLEMIPVDYLSTFTVGLLRKRMGWSCVFHCFESDMAPQMSEVSKVIMKRYSHVQIVPFQVWRSKLHLHAASEEENALYPLLHYFNGMDLPGFKIFDRAKFLMHLQLVGLQQLSRDDLRGDYLDRQLSFLRRVGMLPKPNE